MQAPFILSIDSWTISKVRATFSSIFFLDIDSFDFLMVLLLNISLRNSNNAAKIENVIKL